MLQIFPLQFTVLAAYNSRRYLRLGLRCPTFEPYAIVSRAADIERRTVQIETSYCLQRLRPSLVARVNEGCICFLSAVSRAHLSPALTCPLSTGDRRASETRTLAASMYLASLKGGEKSGPMSEEKNELQSKLSRMAFDGSVGGLCGNAAKNETAHDETRGCDGIEKIGCAAARRPRPRNDFRSKHVHVLAGIVSAKGKSRWR
jgi:hypothetical protein